MKSPKTPVSWIQSSVQLVTSDMGMICIMYPAGPVSTKLDAKWYPHHWPQFSVFSERKKGDRSTWDHKPTRTHGGRFIYFVRQGRHTETHSCIGTQQLMHTQEDAEVKATYFSGFQQDLSLLLVLPLLLNSLQLLKEAKLRANVCRLLIVLIILAWRQRENHCNSLENYKFSSAMTTQILDTNVRTSGRHSVYLYMLVQREEKTYNIDYKHICLLQGYINNIIFW